MEKYVYLAKYKDSEKSNLEYQYKIGFTQNVEERMVQIHGTTTLEIEDIWSCKSKHYSKLESWLHDYYKGHHFKGEWFIFPPNKIESIIEMMQEKKEYFDSLDKPVIIETKEIINNKDVIDNEDMIKEQIINELENVIESKKINNTNIKITNKVEINECKRECPYCHKVFTKQHNLDYHLNIAKKKCTDIMIESIPKIKIYICPVCDKTFTRAYGMKQHYKNFHEIDMNIDVMQNKSIEMNGKQPLVINITNNYYNDKT